jgi:hypothetical protein
MWAMQGEINISIPLDNSSLAGSSAVTGKIINIPDAYKVINLYFLFEDSITYKIFYIFEKHLLKTQQSDIK